MQSIIDRKFANLDAYLDRYPIDSFILGLSGGIDSAVVAKLLNLYNEQRDYKYKIYFVTIMFTSGVGGEGELYTSNQDAAYQAAKHILPFVGGKNTYFDPIWINSFPKPFIGGDYADRTVGIYTDEGYPKTWLIGQFNANLRSVYFYHFANAYNGLVCGTINKSEYLTGYWGKFCDAQVDLQLLFDLYKTEVYELAEYLKLPEFVIKRTPTGDTYNNKTDEDILGANWFEIDEVLKMLVEMGINETPAQLVRESQKHMCYSHQYMLYNNDKFWNHIEKNLFKFEYTPQGIFI